MLTHQMVQSKQHQPWHACVNMGDLSAPCHAHRGRAYNSLQTFFAQGPLPWRVPLLGCADGLSARLRPLQYTHNSVNPTRPLFPQGAAAVARAAVG